MATKPLDPVDAAWFHIDGPVNLAIITSILTTKKRLDFDRVKDVYARRLARFERFRQRVVERGFPIARPHWEDVPDFDVGRHFHHIALPAPRRNGGRSGSESARALAELIGDLASTPLDRGQPLWQVHLVDGVDGGSALIWRSHHCIADGTGMWAVCREIFDTTRDGWRAREAPGEEADARGRARADARGAARTSGRIQMRERTLANAMFVPALDLLERSVHGVVSTFGAGLDAVRHPQDVLEKAAIAVGGAGMLVTELLKQPDPASPLKGEFGMAKRVAWSNPVALADVKSIGAPIGAKINDVLVAAVSGALRAYLRGRGVDVDHASLRAMVPVDLRPPERAAELGNAFGLVILDLAVQGRGPIARVRATKANMDALKRSPEPIAILALFDLFGRVPKPVEDIAVDLFASRASLVMTNVAGPQQRLWLAGVPLERVMFWVPHPGRELGMGISILSYDGTATLGVISDARLVPDPEAITLAFEREFAKMLAAVRKREGHLAGAARAGIGKRPSRRVRSTR